MTDPAGFCVSPGERFFGYCGEAIDIMKTVKGNNGPFLTFMLS
jgi:hypothetical protein